MSTVYYSKVIKVEDHIHTYVTRSAISRRVKYLLGYKVLFHINRS